MSSSVNIAAREKTPAQNAVATFKVWNRKGHYYLGLYFLFFLWLFAFSGLLLNHSSWKFTEFWPMRRVSSFERPVVFPATGSNVDRARDLMRQLGIAGEIDWAAKRADPNSFEFRVNRPGHNFSIIAHAGQGSAKVEHTEINTWGVMRALHTFTGVRGTDDGNDRDWALTTVWVLSMDAVSVGLILMVCSGLYLWFGLPAKRKFGATALALGVVVCGLFVFGLRWIYS